MTLCLFCAQLFVPSAFRPQQRVCGQPACQRRRRKDYHQRKIQTDPEYRQICLESQQKWRTHHPDYPSVTARIILSGSGIIASGSISGTKSGGWAIL